MMPHSQSIFFYQLMTMLWACGLNHKTASLSDREPLAFDAAQVSRLLKDLIVQAPRVEEAALLSTCHRTEIYCKTESIEPVRHWLSGFHSQPSKIFSATYCYQGDGAVGHLVRLGCGLDSMILGEPHILGQIKRAYRLAAEAGSLGRGLRALFEFALSATRKVRAASGLLDCAGSWPQLVMQRVDQIFENLKEAQVLVVGSGDMIASLLPGLCTRSPRQLFWANRNLSRLEHGLGQARAMGLTVDGVTLDALPELLEQADLVVSALSVPEPVIKQSELERAFRSRKHRPMLMIDLGMPRNIESGCADLEDVYLTALDDLESLAEQRRVLQQDAVSSAERMLEGEVKNFLSLQRARNAASTLKKIEARAAAYQGQEVARARALLRGGADVEKTLETMAHRLTRKCLHLPKVRLKEALMMEHVEALTWMQYLFDLEEESDES